MVVWVTPCRLCRVLKKRSRKMKKLMWLAALLAMAMVLIAALPAIAQVTQEDEQEGESADVDQSFEVSQTGDNSSQCPNIQGTANTGNAQNVIDLLQYSGEVDDFEFEEVGSTIDVGGTNTATCDQKVQ